MLIPNRSKNQYIRQTTTNGRKCIFQLDAYSTPRFNATEVLAGASASTSSGEEGVAAAEPGAHEALLLEERFKWVEGEEEGRQLWGCGEGGGVQCGKKAWVWKFTLPCPGESPPFLAGTLVYMALPLTLPEPFHPLTSHPPSLMPPLCLRSGGHAVEPQLPAGAQRLVPGDPPGLEPRLPQGRQLLHRGDPGLRHADRPPLPAALLLPHAGQRSEREEHSAPTFNLHPNP